MTYRQLKRNARWYRFTLHLSIRRAIEAALSEAGL